MRREDLGESRSRRSSRRVASILIELLLLYNCRPGIAHNLCVGVLIVKLSRYILDVWFDHFPTRIVLGLSNNQRKDQRKNQRKNYTYRILDHI